MITSLTDPGRYSNRLFLRRRIRFVPQYETRHGVAHRSPRVARAFWSAAVLPPLSRSNHLCGVLDKALNRMITRLLDPGRYSNRLFLSRRIGFVPQYETRHRVAHRSQ